MPDQYTPLIQHVVVVQRPPRYLHNNVRRSLSVLLGLGCLVAISLYALQTPLRHQKQRTQWPSHSPDSAEYPSWDWPNTNGIPLSELKKLLQETPNAAQARKWSHYYTSGPHLAGKNISQAEWTRDRWREFGVPHVNLVSYDIYINYPKSSRLALLKTGDGEPSEIVYEARLEENVLEEDTTSGLKDRIPVFHGYSANGNATAQYVFANYGTYQDFQDLVNANISLRGNIALVKYGDIFRGLKIKRAQELGMIGVVMYSDPGDDGEITEQNGFKNYPIGPAREPSSVQRGSTQFISIAPGDPTTPGFPSKPGCPRYEVGHSIPSIPSLPISYEDALPLLRALNGQGPSASSFPARWHTGGLAYKGVDYNIGPSHPDIRVNIFNEQEYVINPIWNVIGIINGSMTDEVVILGNHRDAWIAGGAGDPNSGSSALNEVIRSMGEALKAGWKPLRTIIFASWDGEEYGLLGSTEWVEEYLPWLSKDAIAYLNVDVGVRGPRFSADAAPLLNSVLIHATESILSPNQTVVNQTVGDTWSKKINTLGSGSDYTAFQDYAGIPSIDMGFNSDLMDPVYHYHSNFDSFSWMARFGDPDFEYHVTIAKLWAEVASRLIEAPVIPFNATDYAEALVSYIESVQQEANRSHNPVIRSLSLKSLSHAVAKLRTSSVELDKEALSLCGELEALSNTSEKRGQERRQLFVRAQKVNRKYKFFERNFILQRGLDKRWWFKHTVFAPGRWTGYAGAVFPGLVESIADEDIGNFYKWESVLTNQVYQIVASLEE